MERPRRIRWLWLLAALAAFAVVAFAACNGDDDDGGDGGVSGDIQEGGEITVRLTEPESLDPHFADFSNDITIVRMITRGLYDLLPGAVLRPAYAEDLPEISDDGLVLTIKIKDGMQWANGETLDANDFVFGIQRTCNPDNAGFYEYILSNIAGCDDYYGATEASDEEKTGLQNLVGVSAPDNLTLEITLANPQATFVSILALWPAYPAPDETLGSVDAPWPAPPDTPCNGPFCATVLTPGDSLVLERNPNWALEPQPNLDKITLRFIDDIAVAVRAYEAGELDMTRVVGADLPRVRDRDDFYAQPLPITIGLEYYIPDPVVGDVNVRLALSRAIDRDVFAEVVFEGGVIPTTNWVPAEEPGANEAGIYDDIIGFDPEGAAAALAEAGYPDGEGFPGVSMLITDDATDQAAAEFLQNSFLEHLNIELEIEVLDSQTRQERFNAGEFQLLLGGWGHDYPDAENWLIGLFDTGASINQQECSDPEIDAALDAARFEQDQETRFGFLREAERLAVTTLCGYAPLYHRGNFYMISPSLLGVEPTLEDSSLPQFPENWGLAATE
ncbi:MAG: peptide ABC transporter substrate-binding protein [Dehalococcoidia bacterium]